MTASSITSVQTPIEKYFSPIVDTDLSGAKFSCVKNTETDLVTRINLDFGDFNSFCDIQYELPSLFQTSSSLLFGYNLQCSNKEGNTYRLIKSFVDDKENRTNALITHILGKQEISNLLIQVVDRINKEISTQKGMRFLASDLLTGNFDIVQKFIHYNCINTFYSLVDPSRLLTHNELSNFVPSAEEKDELNKVICMYTHVFCNMFDNFLTVVLPIGYVWTTGIYGITDSICIDLKLNRKKQP